MKKRYYFIIILALFIPAFIVVSLIQESHKQPSIKITDAEIITSVPNCSEPTIKLNEIKNASLMDNVDIGKIQVGYKSDKCYAGYFNTQYGTCFVFINPNIHSYIYFETNGEKCVINFKDEEQTKDLYKVINTKNK